MNCGIQSKSRAANSALMPPSFTAINKKIDNKRLANATKKIQPPMLDNWFEDKLRDRKNKGTFRQLRLADGKFDFASNDYLGLALSQDIHLAVLEELKKQPGPINGSTGSRLLAGNSALAERVEEFLSIIFQSKKTLLFNSGYAANMAVLSCIPQAGDSVFYDELVHACMHDGMRLSKASRISFLHNNLNDLEDKIRRTTGRKFIAVESLYSMDGDECPLHELTVLAEKYDASIILDEAHSTGSYGKNGGGLALEKGVANRIPIRIYTFGKAIGAHGACVSGSQALTEYLINYARPFIYSTAPAPHNIITIQKAFEYLAANMYLQEKLQHNIQYFRSITDHTIKKIESSSAIQSILVSGNQRVMELSNYLLQSGFDCRGIRSPTVKAGTERIRICLHSFNSLNEISELVNHIKEYAKE